jgi:tetratricopeptide (TPR) repeat protein
MTSTPGDPQHADIQKKIAAGNFVDALQDIDSLLASEGDHPEALYMAAVCYRYTAQYERAQGCLDILKSLSHDRGRVYQEQGHLHIARDQLKKALAAFANACQLNPVLLASWQKQHQILQTIGRPAEARQALAQVQRLRALPKALIAVTDLKSQGKLFKAETLCRKFLQANPTHVEAMRLLAEIAIQFGVLEDAEFLLESAAKFEPGNTQVKIDFVGVLRKRQKFTEALAAAENLHREHPRNPQLMSLYAIEKMQMGDYEGSIELLDKVLELLPGDAVTLTSRGHALKTCGRQKEAIDSYQQAISSNSWHGDAYYALSNLKTYRFEQEEFQDMIALEQREELGPTSRVHIAFALGKAFEDEHNYARSFECYRQGNELKRQQSNYDSEKMSEELLAQRLYFTREVLDSRAKAGCSAPDPIFIVGLPRAGSTLLEQILSSHSQVDGTLELPNIPSTAQKLKRQGFDDEDRPYPQLLQDFSDEQLQSLGQQYIDETRIHRQGAPFFIDKMPNNFRHIGLIHLILPNAKIIDARREPMACCFSNFQQLFAEGQEFSYDLNDVGRYYSDYVRQMDHWDKVLPGRVFRLQHEELLNDLEGELRRMLDHLELLFEESCLRYYESDRAVRTPSSEQVRMPLYRDAMKKWQNYATWLEPLKEALGDSVN